MSVARDGLGMAEVPKDPESREGDGVVLHVELSERALADLLEAYFGPGRERAAVTMGVMQMVIARASPYLDALWEDFKDSRARHKARIAEIDARDAAAKESAG